MNTTRGSRAEPWLSAAGFGLVAVSQAVTLHNVLELPHLAQQLVSLTGFVLLGVGLLHHYRDERRPAPRIQPSPGFEAPQRPQRIARVLATYHEWLKSIDASTESWASFEQWLRESMGSVFLSQRVRCYMVEAGTGTVTPLAPNAPPVTGTPTEQILRHVAVTGREFLPGSEQHGEHLAALGADLPRPPEWVFPVSLNGRAIGVILVGQLGDTLAQDAQVRSAAARLYNMCWVQLEVLHELATAQTTDKSSGVLTREDFFTAAAAIISEAEAENEPIVVAAVGIEGLRALDDNGRWAARDHLIEELGALMRGRLRAEDIVGRFSDERFLIVLRRLDSGLGRIICQKLLGAAQARIGELLGAQDPVAVRVSLVGSGLTRPKLGPLLRTALGALHDARIQQTDLIVNEAVEAEAAE